MTGSRTKKKKTQRQATKAVNTCASKNSSNGESVSCGANNSAVLVPQCQLGADGCSAETYTVFLGATKMTARHPAVVVMVGVTSDEEQPVENLTTKEVQYQLGSDVCSAESHREPLDDIEMTARHPADVVTVGVTSGEEQPDENLTTKEAQVQVLDGVPTPRQQPIDHSTPEESKKAGADFYAAVRDDNATVMAEECVSNGAEDNDKTKEILENLDGEIQAQGQDKT